MHFDLTKQLLSLLVFQSHLISVWDGTEVRKKADFIKKGADQDGRGLIVKLSKWTGKRIMVKSHLSLNPGQVDRDCLQIVTGSNGVDLPIDLAAASTLC